MHVVSNADNRDHYLYMNDSNKVIRMKIAQGNSNDIVLKQRRTDL